MNKQKGLGAAIGYIRYGRVDFGILTASRKRFIFIGYILYRHAYAEGGRQSLRLTGSIVGGLYWICMCCHGDFTQLNLYSSLCDGAKWEKKMQRGGLMRWNTCKCLLFEEQQSLGNPLSSLSAHCVYECVRPCRELRDWKPEGALSSIQLNLEMQQL